MGWLFYSIKTTAKAECDRICSHESEATRYRVVDSAMVGSTYYAAVEKTTKATGRQFTFAAIILTKGRPKPGEVQDGHNFGYKDMDESCGPCESRCPVRILDKLTSHDDPTFEHANDYARAWRERCRAYHAKPKPKAGQTVAFDNPVTFTNGASMSTFVYVAGSRFRSANLGGLYRITGWKDMAYRVVGAE